MIPNTNAARNPLLRCIPFWREEGGGGVRWKASGTALVAALVVTACSEPTTSVRRFPVLDDVGSSDWASVTVGGDHTCGLKTDGSAYCWGSNQYGQLGVSHTDTTCGSLNARYSCATIPQLVQAGLQFAFISAGQRHTCAITRTREAYCWGSNESGQVSDFGNGGPVLTKVSSSLPWTQITAGFSHTCAVRSDGLLVCWGSNDRGQLGNGSLLPGTTRTLITAPVATASAGQSRTCARTTVGVVYCWGVDLGGRRCIIEKSRTELPSRRVLDAAGMAENRTGASSRFAWRATSRSCSSAPESSRRAASTSRAPATAGAMTRSVSLARCRRFLSNGAADRSCLARPSRSASSGGRSSWRSARGSAATRAA